jgi:predicted TIM-barrel fold metal-dependent hydrolase
MAALWGLPGVSNASERVAFLDAHGIDYQVILPSFPGIAPSLRASRTGNELLMRQCLAAYNTWASETLAGHTDRLIPVTLLDLGDVDWAVSELTRMRARGSRVFNVKASPVGGRSLSHPDFDAVWSAAEDFGMAVMFHVGSGRPTVDIGWADSGRGASLEYLFLCATQAHQLPEIALASMIFGGVFERHPRLHAFASELGIAWVPDWLQNMDLLAVGAIAEFRPLAYKHPMTPSDYAARQVFVTPLPSQPLNPTVGLTPPRAGGDEEFLGW